MRGLAWTALLLTFSVSGAASAAERTVPIVRSASASYAGRRAIIVRATVDLPNSCWSNPRVRAPARDVAPDADGVVPIVVVADSTEGAGVMCAMIYRPGVSAPALRWTHYPRTGLRAVRLIGSKAPVLAVVSGGAP